jgi:hypothetical protein
MGTKGTSPRTRASLVFEPPVLHIGDVLEVQIAIVTPPQWRVHPIELPAIDGVEILERRELPVDTGRLRWIHRTAVRLRPERLGAYEWPDHAATCEDSQGRLETLAIEGRAFEVTSVVPEVPLRDSPFGVQHPSASMQSSRSGKARSGGLPISTAALLSALAMLVGIAIGAASERRVPASRASAAEDSSEPDRAQLDPDAWALAELESLSAAVRQDPRGAASATAVVMRVYADRRFGTDIQGATTHELEQGPPVWFLESRWSDFTSILHDLDDARFTGASDVDRGDLEGAGMESTLERAMQFIRRSSHRGG